MLEPPPVQVYRNLNRTGPNGEPIYSIRDKKTRRVTNHLTHITLTNATFTVSEKGRQRVNREKRKNVHAHITGTPTTTLPDGNWRHATYNPYTAPTFTDRETGQPVHRATHVHLDATGIHYQP